MLLAYCESNQEEREKVKAALPDLDLKGLEGTLQDHIEEAKGAEMLSVFVESVVRKEQLDMMPNLKFIATRSTGFDHIDIGECEKRGIQVASVPTYGENTVAEHAFALILALSRKIFQSYERTEKMDFDREGLEGFDLMGKTLGVVGCGNIGKHAVRIGLGFGMNVLVSEIHPDEKFAEDVGCVFTETLEELLAKSDVITLHVPYIPSATHHLINMDRVKVIKVGAILVNTSRGSIVDTQALLWGLEEGPLSGAGLDVLEEENDTMDHVALLSREFPRDKDIVTLLRNHILVARDDVIITPHNGFNSREARERIIQTTIENIQSFEAGNPQNLVSAK